MRKGNLTANVGGFGEEELDSLLVGYTLLQSL